MKLSRGSVAAVVLLFGGAVVSSGALAQASPPAGAVDLILAGGHVRTSDGWSESLAIRRGVVVAVGAAATVARLAGPMTKTIDLKGATVLPGLHDVHVHPLFGGITQLECVVPQGSTLQQTQAIVKGCAGKVAPGEWLVGGQWDVPALGRAPDRKLLDAVTGSTPALLEDTSGHSSWANSKALALTGVTKATPNPVGGIIERDAQGEPTGVLRESAADLVKAHIPKPTQETIRRAIAWASRTMLSYGITSYTEAAVGFVAGQRPELQAYAALADAGVLKQRVTLCMTWAPDNKEIETSIATRNLYARERVSPSCIKIFLDGVPTDSHTAAMLEPYVEKLAGRDDEAGRKGMLMVKQEVLNEAVTRFDRLGLTVKFHAAGDAAVRAGLNAIEAARKANGFSGQMHNVGHCTFVAKEDIARARAIGATFEVSPYLWGPSPINDSIIAAVGPELIERVWPVRELLDSGSLVVPGSDWSVVPSVNPWIGIEELVTREAPGGSAKSFGKKEAITVAEALNLFTANAARQERMSDRVGRIEPGMVADVIVVEQNPYQAPPRRLHDTKVLMTFIGGEKVYDAIETPVPRSP